LIVGGFLISRRGDFILQIRLIAVSGHRRNRGNLRGALRRARWTALLLSIVSASLRLALGMRLTALRLRILPAARGLLLVLLIRATPLLWLGVSLPLLSAIVAGMLIAIALIRAASAPAPISMAPSTIISILPVPLPRRPLADF
jgi:hypothetical protein